MKNLLKYFLLFLFFLLILSNTLFSQTTNSLNSQLNHFQVIFPALISAGFIGLESILQFIYAAGINSDPVVYDLLDLSLFFAVLPMYFHDFSLGLIFSGISIGFYILEEKLHQIQEYFIEQLPLTGYMEFSFYSTYAIYREGRIKAKSGIYDLNWREKAFGNSEWFELFPYTKKTKWEPYSFWDLAISPILLENLSDLLILTMIPAGFFLLFFNN